MAELDLTFGIELEFLCVHRPDAFTNVLQDLVPDPSEDGEFVPAGRAIFFCLQKTGFRVTGWEELGTVINETSHSKWHVHSDVLLMSEREEAHLPPNHIDTPIEISSRILNFADPNWHVELESLLSVLASMREVFQCEFIVNKSTGLHVHIGNQGGLPVPFNTARRVFQFTTAFERVFDGIHALSRITAPRNASGDRSMNQGLTFFHHHNRHSMPGMNSYHWLENIEKARTPKEIGDMIKAPLPGFELVDGVLWDGHNSVVNFDNLYGGAPLKNTIEFRQHAGSLDQLEICAYVSLLCRVVQYCHTASDVHFIHLLTKAADPELYASDLFDAIGVHPDVTTHYELQQDDEEPEIIGFLPGPRMDITPRISTDQAPLTNLTAQNDTEESENADAAAVYSKTCHKMEDGYYGFSASAGAFPFDCRMIEAMLTFALDRVDPSPEIEEMLSRARAVVFGKLSKMYAKMDGKLGIAQPAIQDELAEWRVESRGR